MIYIYSYILFKNILTHIMMTKEEGKVGEEEMVAWIEFGTVGWRI